MPALQKYWQSRQVKMYFFTSFFGLMTISLFFGSIMMIVRKGVVEALNHPFVQSGLLEFPAAFMLLLLMHKVLVAYVKGQFFANDTLKTLLVSAKLALLYGLVIKPGLMMSLVILGGEQQADAFFYLSHIDWTTTIVGYIFHIGVSSHKVSRDIEAEQELVV